MIRRLVVFDIEHGKESVRLNTLRSVLKTLNLHLTVEGPQIEEQRRLT